MPLYRRSDCELPSYIRWHQKSKLHLHQILHGFPSGQMLTLSTLQPAFDLSTVLEMHEAPEKGDEQANKRH